eukprot:13870056-Alexandrium_andersonii.AAC.1
MARLLRCAGCIVFDGMEAIMGGGLCLQRVCALVCWAGLFLDSHAWVCWGVCATPAIVRGLWLPVQASASGLFSTHSCMQSRRQLQI